MAELSAQQIAQVAINAGLPESKAATAVAIALAESGGNPRSYNGSGRDRSYGLWQINMNPAELDDDQRRREIGITDNEQLFDPLTNAKAMLVISNGGKNWRPWTTYTRGTFLTHMGAARKAVGETTATGSVPIALPTDGGGFGNISKVFATLTNPDEWKRYGLFLAGWILVAIALVKFTGTGGAVKKAAKVLSPAKIAKVVKK